MLLHSFGPHCDVIAEGARFYHWHISRYAADGVHVISLLFCLMLLLRDRRAQGVSLKSQALFFAVFSLRYLDLFICKQFVYLIVLKIFFWCITCSIVVLLFLGRARSDKRDTLQLPVVVVPALLATLMSDSYESVVGLLWALSQHLEGWAMLPQYIYCYRDAYQRPGHPQGLTLWYVLCLGSYRSMYGLSWFYKSFFGASIDLSRWVSTFVNLALFLDFLVFRFRGASPLFKLVLATDDELNKARAAAEGALFGRYLVTELHVEPPQAPLPPVPLAIRVGRSGPASMLEV